MKKKKPSLRVQLLIAVGGAILATAIEYFLAIRFLPELAELFSSPSFVIFKFSIHAFICGGVFPFSLFFKWTLKKLKIIKEEEGSTKNI